MVILSKIYFPKEAVPTGLIIFVGTPNEDASIACLPPFPPNFGYYQSKNTSSLYLMSWLVFQARPKGNCNLKCHLENGSFPNEAF